MRQNEEKRGSPSHRTDNKNSGELSQRVGPDVPVVTRCVQKWFMDLSNLMSLSASVFTITRVCAREIDLLFFRKMDKF